MQPAAGLLPLRGHSNVQGIGTVGVKPILVEDVDDQFKHTGAQLHAQKVWIPSLV